LQLGKWKSHSQSVDIVTVSKPGINTDSLDGGLGYTGSDPGSTDGHTFGLDQKTSNGSSSTAGQNGRKISMKPGMMGKNQPSLPEEPPKAKPSWSEHVWSE
jgi:hypothetical protein